MSNTLLLTFCLVVILLTGYFTVTLNSNTEGVSKTEKETAVNQAKFLYAQKKIRGEDFSNGPCLSNALMPNWVVDIVHSPREDIDNLEENQCPAILEGRANHLVELDIDGNLIKVQ